MTGSAGVIFESQGDVPTVSRKLKDGLSNFLPGAFDVLVISLAFGSSCAVDDHPSFAD